MHIWQLWQRNLLINNFGNALRTLSWNRLYPNGVVTPSRRRRRTLQTSKREKETFRLVNFMQRSFYAGIIRVKCSRCSKFPTTLNDRSIAIKSTENRTNSILSLLYFILIPSFSYFSHWNRWRWSVDEDHNNKKGMVKTLFVQKCSTLPHRSYSAKQRWNQFVSQLQLPLLVVA